MGLANAVEASRHTAQSITWSDENGTAVDLTGATITGRTKNNKTGTVTTIDGTLALVTASSGIFSWTYGAVDVGTVGKYTVQFIATFADTTNERSKAYEWEVLDAFDV